MLNRSTSFLGDALEILPRFQDNRFDLCIADPPYNISKKRGLAWAFSKHVTIAEKWDQFSREDYLEFCEIWLKECFRIVKPNGNLLIFGTFHNIYDIGSLLQKLDRKILNSIIWFKPNAQPNITCRMLTESTEQILWAANETEAKASKWTFDYAHAKTYNEGKQLRNLWSFPVTSRTERLAEHPTQKPLKLIERLVLLCSNPNDWILDPFAGVGTTGAAALRNGRHFCLIERDPRYFEAQQKRLGQESVEFFGKNLAQTPPLTDSPPTP